MATVPGFLFGPSINVAIPFGPIVTMRRVGEDAGGGVPDLFECAVWDFLGGPYIGGRTDVRRARFYCEGALELRVVAGGPAIDVPVGQIVELSFEDAPATLDDEPVPGFRVKRRGWLLYPAIGAACYAFGDL